MRDRASYRLVKFINKCAGLAPKWATMRFCEWINGYNYDNPNYYQM